jgi:hypothetical protein
MTDIAQWWDGLPKWGQLIVFFISMFGFTGLFALLTSGSEDGYD